MSAAERATFHNGASSSLPAKYLRLLRLLVRPWEIDGELWARIEPLLPLVSRNPRRPGRKRLDSRKVLCGILFVLYIGIRWEFLPQELGFGSGMTC